MKGNRDINGVIKNWHVESTYVVINSLAIISAIAASRARRGRPTSVVELRAARPRNMANLEVRAIKKMTRSDTLMEARISEIICGLDTA